MIIANFQVSFFTGNVYSLMLSNSIRSKKWVVNCRREDLDKKDPKYLYNNCKICSEHFEDSMFSGHLKNRLKNNAVPNPPKSIGAKH